MKLRNMLCKVSILAVIITTNTSVFAQDKQGLNVSERNIPTSEEYVKTEDLNDLYLITIKRATGEIEIYGYQDLFNGEPTSSNINEVKKIASTKPTKFTLSISPNSIAYSKEQLNLNINDQIKYIITPLLGESNFKVGLRNNVDGTFKWTGEHYGIPGYNSVSGSFTATESGNFSFAIYNVFSASNTFMGNYYR